MGLSLPARAHCPCANTPSPPVWQQCRPRSIPPALPGSPSQPTDPSPHRHGPAKWTATAFIGIARHCQMLMALAEKESYPCIYQVILTLFLKTLLPRTPEVNVIIGIIYISGSFVASGSGCKCHLEGFWCRFTFLCVTLQTEAKPLTRRLAKTSNSNRTKPPRFITGLIQRGAAEKFHARSITSNSLICLKFRWHEVTSMFAAAV